MIKIERRASVVLYRFLSSNMKGKTFLIPANVCPIVPLVFLKAEVKFIFVDIDHAQVMNKNICMSTIKSNHIDGILFIHAYGKTFNNDDFYSKLKNINPNLVIIDDKCLCIPDLTFKVKKNVDLELFSTGYSKFIELSFGGWGIFHEKYLYEENILPYSIIDYNALMESVKNSLTTKNVFKYLDTNWLDTLPLENENEYFTLIRKNHLNIKKHKQKINSIYDKFLPEHLKFEDGYANWRYMIKCHKRNNILEKIYKNNLFVGTNFPSVAFIFNQQTMPIAEFYEKININLFNDFRINEIMALKICEVLKSELV